MRKLYKSVVALAISAIAASANASNTTNNVDARQKAYTSINNSAENTDTTPADGTDETDAVKRTVQMWLTDENGNMIDAAGYWNETITDNGDGTYRFENLMESGMQLDIALDENNRMTLSSPWWSEDNGNMYPNYYSTTDCWYYCNSWNSDTQSYEYWPFYPHGKDAYLWIAELQMYTETSTDYWNSYYWENTEDAANSYFSISLGGLKLNTDSDTRWWQELRFRIIGDDEQIPEEYLPDAPETPDTPDTPDTPEGPVAFHDSGVYSVEMWLEGTEGTIGETWNETITVNEDGTYSFADLMNSGMDLNIALDANCRMTLSSSWLTEEEGNVYPNNWSSTDCYYYCNRWSEDAGEYVYWPFYPYGKDAGTYVEYITMYTDANPQNWYSYYWDDQDDPAESYFCITLGYLKMSNESNYREWASLCFSIKEKTGEVDGISSIAADKTSATGVYNMQGIKVAETPASLPAGLYIVNGKKTAVSR